MKPEEKHPKRITREERQHIIELAQQGHGTRAICTRTGLQREAVRRVILAAGLKKPEREPMTFDPVQTAAEVSTITLVGITSKARILEFAARFGAHRIAVIPAPRGNLYGPPAGDFHGR